MAYRTEIEKLEQRHAENPKQWFAALADAYRKQGDVDLAIEYVKSGLDQRPDYASAHIVLGRCYLDKNLDEDAAQAFEQVLELDAENIIALKSLEEIAERKGDVDGARHWLDRLLEVDPMNDEAHESLARLGENKEAAEPEPEPEPVAEEAQTPDSEEAPAAAEPLEPIQLESVDADDESTEPTEPIEPIELEMVEADANSLLAGLQSEESSPWGDAEEETTPAIEPIELETQSSDAGSLLANVTEGGDEELIPTYLEPFELDTTDTDDTPLLSEMPGAPEPEISFENASDVIEPVEIETPEADASSLLTDLPPGSDYLEQEESLPAVADFAHEEHEELEVPMEAEYVLQEAEEPVEVDGVSSGEEEPSLRDSVPPTKEVAAFDLEAMRVADEVIAQPTVDSAVVDEEEVEASGTEEIDAVELERLREQDEMSSGFAPEAETVDEVAEEDAMVGTFYEDAGWDVADGAGDIAVVAEQAEPEGPAEEPDRSDEDSDALPLIMPEDEGDGEASTDAEPEPVVTETMAEVYAKQGLFEQAREIYEVLVMQHADDARLKARLEELTEREKGALQETRKSRFSVAATGGESAVSYLRRLFAVEDEAGSVATAVPEAVPEAVAEPEVEPEQTPLEEAFADEPLEAPGEPTVAAPDEVSLASVFDGGMPEPSPVGDSDTGFDRPQGESGIDDGVSFDEFYGSEPRPTLPEANGPADDEKPVDEDDDFKNWLKGLKT